MRTILVTDYLEQTAEQFPDKVAFADEKDSLTFSELRSLARHIAMGLVNRELFKKPVVVYLEKSPACVAAFLGTAYSGNFYTPIDTEMPRARIDKIMSTLEPVAIITNEAHADTAREFAGRVEVITLEMIQSLCVDDGMLDVVTEKIVDTDVLYVLFTSGSTGTPKGVIVPHKGVITYTEWCAEEFQIDSNTIFGNQTPFYFSMSVLDIYQTIRNGATTYIIPRLLFSFPIKLLQYIVENKINMIYWVPTALCIVANLKALGRVDISCVKQILFAGEVMPTKQLNMWRKALPNALFADLFGPTEVTDICAFYKIGRILRDDEAVPIGKACRNSELIILTEDNKKAVYGEVGELCVTGSTLAYGYYNNPKKTKEAFVQNPLNTSYPEIIYRTGDLVRYNDLGELVYVGRKDFQIKHMGHRIELGEIEAAVSSLAEIERCCCLYDTKRSKIVLFYTGDADSHWIVEQLRALVPEYMIPNRKIHLDDMPMNLNGKIDRVALKEQV